MHISPLSRGIIWRGHCSSLVKPSRDGGTWRHRYGGNWTDAFDIYESGGRMIIEHDFWLARFTSVNILTVRLNTQAGKLGNVFLGSQAATETRNAILFPRYKRYESTVSTIA